MGYNAPLRAQERAERKAIEDKERAAKYGFGSDDEDDDEEEEEEQEGEEDKRRVRERRSGRRRRRGSRRMSLLPSKSLKPRRMNRIVNLCKLWHSVYIIEFYWADHRVFLSLLPTAKG